MSNQGREYLIIPQIVIEPIEKKLRDERYAKEIEGRIEHEQRTDYRDAEEQDNVVLA